MKIIFRVDASVNIGAGHVLRCLVLARELRSKGCNIIFSCIKYEGNLIQKIIENGFSIIEANENNDPIQFKRILKKNEIIPNWIIIDSYDIGLEYESSLRDGMTRIMIIDDLLNRKHECDLFLDQNYGEKPKSYNRCTNTDCRMLLGPKYALIREQFRNVKTRKRGHDNQVKLFVFMGGSDSTNETVKVLLALQKYKGKKNIFANVIIGSINPRREEIKQISRRMKNIKLSIDVSDMAALMNGADLAIGAGGTANWERISLGIPSIVIITAENQKYFNEELYRDGYLLKLYDHNEITSEKIAEDLSYIIGSVDLKGQSKNISNLVDGLGAVRVAEALLNC